MACISSVESARCFTFWFANSTVPALRCPRPRRSFPTTGISWMDFGFFCWRFFTWASEILIFQNSTLQKFGDGIDDSRDLPFAQFRIHRQRKNLFRRALRMREISRLVAQRGIQGLQM